MNKKFKRFLASMLAVLMIISAMPFSAFAIEQSYVDSYNDFIGYADLDKYKDDMYNPDTEEGLYYAGVGTTLRESEADPDSEIYLMDCIVENYKPVFHVIVGDYSSRTKYYGMADTTWDDSIVKDPTDLHAGDKITITVELSGMDNLFNVQCAFNYKSEYLTPKYYKKSGAKYNWSASTANANSVVAVSTNGEGIVDDGGTIVNPSANRAYYAQGSLKNPYAVFLGKNVAQEMGTGTFGLMLGTLSFEVVADCSLEDAITWDLANSRAVAYSLDDLEFYDQSLPGHETHYTNSKLSLANGMAKMVYEGAPQESGCDHANTTTTETVTQAATCIATGLKTVTVTCDDCGEVVSTDENVVVAIDPANHAGTTTTTEDVTLAPTCSATGLKTVTVTCDDCKNVISETKDVEVAKAADNHVNTTTTETVTKAATCAATGLKTVTVTCDDCGAVVSKEENVEIPKDYTNHVEYTSEVTTPATCEAAGVTTWTCACGNDSYTTNEPAALTHNYGDWTHVADTEKADAQHSRVCANDANHVETAACDFDREVTKTPAIKQEGEATYTCKVCGYSYTEVLPAVDCEHANTTDVETSRTAATCVAKGEVKYNVVCDDCNEIIDTKTVELAIDPANHADAETATRDENVVAATCAAKGSKDVVTYCTACDAVLSTETVELAIDPANHADAETATRDENVVAATCAAKGSKDVVTYCTACDAVLSTETVELAIDPANHADAETATKDENVVAATCAAKGSKDVVTYCTACDAVLSTETVELAIDPANHADAETATKDENVVAATCAAKGSKDVVTYCTACDAVLSTETVELAIDPANHADAATATRDVNVTPATCGADGSKDVETYCTACDAVLSTETGVVIAATGNHTAGAPVTTVTKPATVDEAGVQTTTVNCTVCGTLMSSVDEEIAIVPSYTVTVDAAKLGTVTINGVDVTNGAAVKVAKNPVSKVTLAATPVENATFVGWTIDGKSLVSTDATYVATVLANVTYTPVFALADTEFTVTFVDAYGNVIDTQKVTSAAGITMPTAPTRAGYTFTGWSMTDEEIAAIDSATTIQAVYEKNASDLFTVTANGCTITVNGETVNDVATDVAYDTLVTVTADDATAWKIGDVIVAYGDTYTFYVGSDVEVTPVTDTTVKAEPTVANIDKTEVVEANGLKRCTFLATRSMEGFTCVNYGFVYGATNNTAITLDDVDGKTIKAFYCQTGVDQFSLTYGLKSQTGTVVARAFVVYIDAKGDTQVKYAEGDNVIYSYEG
ncbi:MAG: InlB B-repeat-containing protein [Clostridiales bacterium]|nr:InlB B-repeat-containing protein [Clostridiales bacterium]